MINLDEFVLCEQADSFFGKTKKALAYDGNISIDYLTSPTKFTLETGAREYQREKVASLAWKQAIIKTIIGNGFRRIPQIHIRVIKAGKSFRFELIDGQQRVSAPISFINGDFSLPNTSDFNFGNGVDLRGYSFQRIKQDFPDIKAKILETRISCLWYENLTDEQTADLFINVLNNTNAMKPQEIRNAFRGELSAWVRNTARFDDVDLFERIKSSKGNKVVLKHFSEGFTLKQRMEVDEWLSELVYLQNNGYRKGITQKIHTDWIERVQSSGEELSTEAQFEEFKELVIEPLMKFATDTITSVPDTLKYKLVPMFSQILILYGYELKRKYGSLDIPTYVTKFFEVYDKWSNTDKKKGPIMYANEKMWGTKDEQMEPFNKLFGGKNPKAIGTITYVLDKELKADIDSFGVVELDNRTTFPKADIIRKWEEQGRKCYYTNKPLDVKSIAGDHKVPRSWGIKKGGVTEYHNLVVTSKVLNNKKLNMGSDDFQKLVTKEKAS
jgi:hypothetical protein